MSDPITPFDPEETGAEETAAIVKAAYSNPLDLVTKGFLSIVLSSHVTFRSALVASLLNEKALETLQTSDMSLTTGFDLTSLLKALSPARLRDSLQFKPGNGTNQPFELVFIEDLFNIPKRIVDQIVSYMPEAAKSEEGMALDEFAKAVDGFNVSTTVQTQLEANYTSFKEKFVDLLDGVMDFRIRVIQKTFNENTNSDSLIFQLSIQTEGSLYTNVVDAEEFEPYLLYLWVMNSLTSNRPYKGRVVDLRKAQAHSTAMQKFAAVSPKVNAEGFALHGSGAPIFIPPRIDAIDKFLEVANSAVDEDGTFNHNMITEKGFKNVVLYVDWVNDIMAYVSNTGRLNTMNLGGVYKLDKATEFMFMSTKLIDGAFKNYIPTLSASIGALEPNNAVKFAESTEVKQHLQNTPPDKIFTDIFLRSTASNDEDVRLYHLAGYKLEDFDDDPRRLIQIQAVRAMFKLFAEELRNSSEALVVADKYRSMGILYRLIGIEYIIQTVARSTKDRVVELKQAYDAEREKARVDYTKRSFDIPNIVTGGQFTGLLPHQGRILSSTEKTPATMMLPVKTGGGKCLTGDHYLPTTRGIESVEEIFERSGKQDAEGFACIDRETKVFTRTGLKRVSHSFSRMGDTVRIRMSDGDFIEGLPEHRVLGLIDGKLDFVRLDAAEGVWLPKTLNTNVFPETNASLAHYRTYQKVSDQADTKNAAFHTDNGFRRPKTMTEDFARLLGYIVSEGYIPKDYGFITITNHDPEILDHIHDLAYSVLRYTPPSRSKVELKINGRVLTDYLRNILGGSHKSHEQCVPHAVRTSTKAVQAAFLSTLYEGDGTIYRGSMGSGKKGKWKLGYCSKSETLIRQLKVMLSNFGIEARISNKTAHATNGTPGNACEVFGLGIYQTGFEQFENEIGFVSSRKRGLLREANEHYAFLKEHGQNTNVVACGDHNQIPCGTLVNAVLQHMDTLVGSVQYLTAGEKPRVANYSLAYLWRQNGDLSLSMSNKTLSGYGETINRYTLGRFVNLIDNLPAEVADVVYEDDFVYDSYMKIRSLLKKSWVRVDKVEKGSYQRVYDLSVPGPHEYSVQGIMSHNTIISAVTAIKAIENIRSIPMISTKGNLVRGTITELNAITQGKINAIPFRPGTLRAMKRTTDLKTFARFLEWYKALPPNTILVNAYSDYASKRKIYEDLDTLEAFGDAPVYITQYLIIIKLLGIKTFIGDESHQVKNPDSARSRNSYAAASQGDVKCAMSGTQVSNTVIDLVGQTRYVSPYIFGDDAQNFADNYGVSTGLITDEDATIIKSRLQATTAYHEATREDWSYMLPILQDKLAFAQLTPRQEEFYNVLMLEAEMIMIEQEKSKKKAAAIVDESDDSDDDDDDDEDEDDDVEEEDEDAAILAKAKAHLQKVEAFLVAPDDSEEYLAYRGRPGEGVTYPNPPEGDDLVSPKVRLADKYIEQHLTTHRNNLAKNKIIVFGWNKSASVHFMKHSKFASIALHYTAGDMEVARRYENDPHAILMVADEGSVREGFNWQMTSLILRQQSVWAPGEHEQAVARMFRPDPRGRYNREKVEHIWLLSSTAKQPTLDGVKMARLISKSISNARLTYEGRIEWRRVSAVFDDMEMFSMNLNRIFHTTAEDVEPYFGNWNTFVDWENDNNLTAKRRMAEALERQTGKTLLDDRNNIIDINEFVKLAMYEVKSTKDIPGSKRVWVPWTPGAIPPDPDNWGYAALGNQNVPVGTVVYTQFGPAIIESILKKGLKVRIYNGKLIGVRKGSVMTVNPDKYAQFSKIVTDPSKWREHAMDVWGLEGGVKTTKPSKQPKQQEEEVIHSLEDIYGNKADEQPLDEDDAILDEEDVTDPEIHATIINGWPALMVTDDLSALSKAVGWQRVDPFLTMTFRTWDELDKFIDVLNTKVFVPQDVMDKLDDEIEEFKTGKALVLSKQISHSAVRNFFKEQHRKLGKTKDGQKFVVKPYLIAVERDIKLAFDIDSHDPRVISWLLQRKGKVPGLKAVKKNEAIWVNIFSTAKEAYQDLEALSKTINIDLKTLRQDLVDVKDEIVNLRKARSRPSV